MSGGFIVCFAHRYVVVLRGLPCQHAMHFCRVLGHVTLHLPLYFPLHGEKRPADEVCKMSFGISVVAAIMNIQHVLLAAKYRFHILLRKQPM